MAIYERHQPENSVLFQVIARSWPRISQDYAIAGESIPAHVETEFERYRKCGILDYGFVRLVCKSCDKERVVGFSCKGRGFCPRCGSRRREQTAERLEGEVWPVANARQWVLSFPKQVRYWLARSPELFAEVIRVVTDEISFFYEQSSIPFDRREHALTPSSGGITFIQRFGSNLVCNPHLHMIFLDGVYASTQKGIEFFPYQTFSTEAMFDVLTGIAHRLENLFRQKGYVNDDDSMNDVEQDSDVPLPFTPRASKSYRRKGLLDLNPNYKNKDPNMISIEGWANIMYRWFSLHAGVAIKGDDRFGIKRLFRYTARSSVTLSQLKYVTPEDPDRSDVELQLKREWKDGTKSLMFTQRDLVEALASLIPQPWFNLTRYCGRILNAVAPAHAWRDFIVPTKKRKSECHLLQDSNDHAPPPTGKPSSGRAPAEYWLPWAELLRRTVGVDPEICSCGARMVIDDAITDAETITEILTRMGISTVGPPNVARSAGELDYVYDV